MQVRIQIDAPRAPLSRTDLTTGQLPRTEKTPHSLDVEPEQVRSFFRRHQVSVVRE
jgi:hypothetical protein